MPGRINSVDVDRQLADAFFAHHPTEVARTLDTAPLAEIAALLSETDRARAAPAVSAMDPAVAAEVLGRVDPAVAARIVEELPPRAAGVLLRRASAPARSAILERLPSRTASRLGALLQYPEGSAGALLDPSVRTAPPDLTAQAMLDRLRVAGATVPSYLYVVDRHGVLMGVMTLRELIGAVPDARLGAAAKRRIATLPATADRAAIVTHPAWRDLRALPVVDRDGRFLGIVRHETVHELASGASASGLEPAATGIALEIGELVWDEGVSLVEDLFEALHDMSEPARPIDTVAG
ncbi:MAG: magnesium transporter [Acidobacteria bacterium]|nr:magnesium transporter [Acidobacteriota bacterium]MXZ71962.1 magnesium transporter [Acidobacteriota bacterium]MYJ04776.1 magnesium transporter [Acidobacteriota bacterium]